MSWMTLTLGNKFQLAIMATRKQSKENMCIAIYIYIYIIFVSQ